MKTISYEDKLMEAAGNKKLFNSLLMFALELEASTGINADKTIKTLTDELTKIRNKNGGKLPSYRQTYKLMHDAMERCMAPKRVSEHYYYIKSQGMYVIMTGYGEYTLTPFKHNASKFPSHSAAERFIRELWIDDGEIED